MQDAGEEFRLIETRDCGSFASWYVAGGAGEEPPNYETAIDANRGQYGVGDGEATRLELGPNRCAAI